MLLLSDSPRECQSSFVAQLRAIRNFEILKTIELGRIESAVVTRYLRRHHTGQVLWHGRYIPAELLSNLLVPWTDLPTQLEKNTDVILLGIHHGNYVVTTEDFLTYFV